MRRRCVGVVRWMRCAVAMAAVLAVGACAGRAGSGTALPPAGDAMASSPAKSPVSTAQPSVTLSPTADAGSGGGVIASGNPSASPPVGGFYLCGRADLCDDTTGQVIKTLSQDSAIYGATLSAAGRAVYLLEDRPTTADISGPAAYHITRAGFDGGPEHDVVNAPADTADEAFILGTPRISFDGSRLAYDQTSERPSTSGPATVLGSRILLTNPAVPGGPAVAVPTAMAGPPVSPYEGYVLIGWSPDGRTLYYFAGPSDDIRAVTFNTAGQPVDGRLVFHPQAPDQSCALGPSQATVSPTGAVLFTGYCHPDGVRIYQLSPGPTPQVGILTSLISGQPNWLVDQLAVDTTGREIAFDLIRVPGGGDCVAGGGTVRVLDRAILAEHIEWHGYACPPDTLAVPSQ